MKILHFINDMDTKGGAEQLVSQYILNDSHEVLTLKYLKYSLFSIKKIYRLIKFIRKMYLIHVHLFPCFYFGIIFKFIFNKHIVYTEHNSWNRRRKYKVFRVIERYIYSKYDRITCISKGTKEALIQWIGINENIILVENGVNLSTNFIKYPEKRNARKFTLLMIGSFSEQKNQTLLINYVSKNLGFNLMLVGSGPMLIKCKNLARALNVSDQVYFVEAQTHPIILPYKPDLYVQCSHWEGFGLTVIEAISDGIPAIGSAVPGLGNLLENFYSFENNLGSLSRVINKVKSDSNYFSYQKQEINKYDFDYHLVKLDTVYNDISS